MGWGQATGLVQVPATGWGQAMGSVQARATDSARARVQVDQRQEAGWRPAPSQPRQRHSHPAGQAPPRRTTAWSASLVYCLQSWLVRSSQPVGSPRLQVVCRLESTNFMTRNVVTLANRHHLRWNRRHFLGRRRLQSGAIVASGKRTQVVHRRTERPACRAAERGFTPVRASRSRAVGQHFLSTLRSRVSCRPARLAAGSPSKIA